MEGVIAQQMNHGTFWSIQFAILAEDIQVMRPVLSATVQGTIV